MCWHGCLDSLVDGACFGLLSLGKGVLGYFQGEMRFGDVVMNEDLVDMFQRSRMSCWNGL